MRILLSIKPEYADKIYDGTKHFEFRKCIFRDERVTKVQIYETSPVKLITGEFSIAGILQDTPKALWKKTKDYSGLNIDKFYRYFEGCSNGYAIEIENPIKYKSAINPWEKSNTFHPPQSFMYID